MRNIEVLRDYFLGKDPQLKETLADNSLRLIGVRGEYFVQRKELLETIKSLESSLNKAMQDMEGDIYIDIDTVDEDLKGEIRAVANDLGDLARELERHEGDNTRHLTQDMINKINSTVTEATVALVVAREVQSALPGVVTEATAVSKQYTDKVKEDLEKQIGDLNVPTVIDPTTGEPTDQSLGDALEKNPQMLINPEYFYRFKNMVDNSSFEVFDGNTGIPIGWDNGIVTEDASMFNSHSLQIDEGQIVKQTQRHCADVTWLSGAYETDGIILAFYHKWDPVGVKIYDLVNEEFLQLTPVNDDMTLGTPATEIVFNYDENWNQYRKMVMFVPEATTRQIRIEFNCKTGYPKHKCFIDAPMMEPYLEGEFPSLYKDGRYSTSAYQLLNPPPADVDRFTPLEHFSIANSQADPNGNIYHEELLRSDGTLAIMRQASNPDTNGYYQTIVETFYKKDGVTVNYVDTYSFTYTATGAVLTQSKTTTEVV